MNRVQAFGFQDDHLTEGVFRAFTEPFFVVFDEEDFQKRRNSTIGHLERELVTRVIQIQSIGGLIKRAKESPHHKTIAIEGFFLG